MLGFFDPQTGRLRMWRLVSFDTVVVGTVWAIVSGAVSGHGIALVAYPTLLLFNAAIVWRASRRWPRSTSPTKVLRTSALAWLGALAFSIGGVAEVVRFCEVPEVATGIQAAMGVLLSAYAWFLVLRVRGLGG
jgi:hypothetical protein